MESRSTGEVSLVRGSDDADRSMNKGTFRTTVKECAELPNSHEADTRRVFRHGRVADMATSSAEMRTNDCRTQI